MNEVNFVIDKIYLKKLMNNLHYNLYHLLSSCIYTHIVI